MVAINEKWFSSGGVVEAYDNDVYGNTLIFTGPTSVNNWFGDDDVQSTSGANEIIYCGYRYDAETENYYVRNRYYAAHLGRWLTRDPIGYSGGINLYAYVASSPVGNVDAAGLGGGNPNLYPPPPPLSPQVQALLQQYSGRNAKNYPSNLPPPYDGVGGAVLGSLLAGGWYFTGAKGRERIGYTDIHKVMVDGHCIKLAHPVYAPAAQIARGGTPPGFFVWAFPTAVATAASLTVGPELGMPLGILLHSALAYDRPLQKRFIRVYGPTFVGHTWEVIK